MTLNSKLDKLEESLLTDEQITELVGLRRILRRELKTMSMAEALAGLKKNYPDYPAQLLTMKAQGRVLAEEKRRDIDDEWMKAQDAPAVENLARQVIKNILQKVPDIGLDELIERMKLFECFHKADFEKLREEFL